MEKIIEYKVTGGGNPKHLAEAVNQLIGDGFEPFGNVFQQGGGVFAANGKERAERKPRLSFVKPFAGKNKQGGNPLFGEIHPVLQGTTVNLRHFRRF